MSTIYIMWLREMKRFIRSRSRLLGALGQPVLYFLALGYGLGSVFQAAGQGNYINFLAPGIIGMTIIFTSMFNGMQIIWDRQFGFLKETLVAPVPRFSIMFGRTLGGATVATLQGILVLIVMVLTGFRPDSWFSLIPAVLLMLLIAFLFSALGIAIASILKDMQGFQLIMNFLIMPLFFLSGAIFPLQSAPAALKLIARFDPLAYGIDAMRHFLINMSAFGIVTDVLVLFGFTAFFLVLGSYLFSKIEA